jgi:hypothetical protein
MYDACLQAKKTRQEALLPKKEKVVEHQIISAPDPFERRKPRRVRMNEWMR